MTKFSPHPQAFWGVMSLLKRGSASWSLITNPLSLGNTFCLGNDLITVARILSHLFWRILQWTFHRRVNMSVSNLISQYLQARWSHERAFGEKLLARRELSATFSPMRNPPSFSCSSPSSEPLSWQSFWPKVLMPLKSLAPHPICPQTHILSHCHFPTLLSPPQSPERQSIETRLLLQDPSMMQTKCKLTSLTGLLSTGVTGADLVRPKSIVRFEWLRFFT